MLGPPACSLRMFSSSSTFPLSTYSLMMPREPLPTPSIFPTSCHFEREVEGSGVMSRWKLKGSCLEVRGLHLVQESAEVFHHLSCQRGHVTIRSNLKGQKPCSEAEKVTPITLLKALALKCAFSRPQFFTVERRGEERGLRIESTLAELFIPFNHPILLDSPCRNQRAP